MKTKSKKSWLSYHLKDMANWLQAKNIFGHQGKSIVGLLKIKTKIIFRISLG